MYTTIAKLAILVVLAELITCYSDMVCVQDVHANYTH
jgi:hypothetical protein